MKKLLLLFVVFSLLQPHTAFAQREHVKTQINGRYVSKKGMCSSSFLFLPGGLFYYEGGCEDRSFILKGGYKVLKDTINFFPDPEPIRYSIKSNPKTNDAKLSISVLDNEGQALPFFNVFVLTYPIYGDTLNYIQSLETNSKGILIVNTSNFSAISFDRYNPKRINKDSRFKWEALSSVSGSIQTVQFNYPEFCLSYTDIQVAGGFTPLLIKDGEDALVDDQNNIFKKKNLQ